MSYRRNLPRSPAGPSGIPYGSGSFNNENRMYGPQTASSGSSRAYTAQSPLENVMNEAPVRAVHLNDLANAPAGHYIHPDTVFSLDNVIDEDLEARRPLLDQISSQYRYEPRFASPRNDLTPPQRPIKLPRMYATDRYVEGPANMRGMYERNRYNESQSRRPKRHEENRYDERGALRSEGVAAHTRRLDTIGEQGDVVDLKEVLAAGPPVDIAKAPRVISQGSTQFPEVPQLIPPFRPSSLNTTIPPPAAIDLLGKIVLHAEAVMSSASEVLSETEKTHFLHKFLPGPPKTKTLLDVLEVLCDGVGRACHAIEDRETAFKGVRPEEVKATYDIAVDTCIRLSYRLGNIAMTQKDKHRIQAMRKQMLTLLDLLGTKLRVLVLCMAPYIPRPRESNVSPSKEDDHFLGKRMKCVHEYWAEVSLPLAHKLKKKHDQPAAT